jgi:hypothetical protein
MNRKPPNADSIQGLKSSREHDVRSFPVNFPVSREMVGTIVKSVVGGSGVAFRRRVNDLSKSAGHSGALRRNGNLRRAPHLSGAP